MADRQRRIYPFEIAAWAGLIAAVLFLRSRHLRIDWATFEYTVPPLVPVMTRFLVAGLAVYAVYLALRRRKLGPYLRRLATWRWWVMTARLWAAIIVFTYSYFWLKVCVPLVNEALWDRQLWVLDRWLHLGYSPSLFLVELTGGTILTGWLDTWYGLWLPSVSLGIAFFCAMPAARARRRFVLSCVLIWTLGAWLYTAVPALGPIYANTDLFAEVTPDMPKADAGQRMLWANYQTVMAGRSGSLKQFNPTRGIAALPSLHVGAHWLLMLWCRRLMRPLFIPLLVGTLLTFLGSIVTGWHYAVDGYAGIALAQLSFWIALRTERSRDRPGMVAE